MAVQSRCGLPCGSQAGAGCHPAPSGGNLGSERSRLGEAGSGWKYPWRSKACAKNRWSVRAGSAHRSKTDLALRTRSGLQSALLGSRLGARNVALAQPTPPGSGFGAQKPVPVPLRSSSSAERPVRAASPHPLEAAVVLKGRCGLPAPMHWKQMKQLWPLQIASPHPLAAVFNGR